MIERQVIDGRPATVAYLTANFEPADADSAELVKVIFDDGETLMLTPADDTAADQAMMRTIQMTRHGATAMNKADASEDRIRGHVDIPLSEEGRQEAYKLARKMRKNPPDYIVSSDLSRALETARIISEVTGVPIVEVSRGYRPWDVGKYTGELSEVVVPVLKEYLATDPEREVPGGESFCQFRDRFLATLAAALRQNPTGTIAVVAHHRNERVLFAWREAGYPEDGNVDIDTFAEKGEATGSCQEIKVPTPRLEAAANRV